MLRTRMASRRHLVSLCGRELCSQSNIVWTELTFGICQSGCSQSSSSARWYNLDANCRWQPDQRALHTGIWRYVPTTARVRHVWYAPGIKAEGVGRTSSAIRSWAGPIPARKCVRRTWFGESCLRFSIATDRLRGTQWSSNDKRTIRKSVV